MTIVMAVERWRQLRTGPMLCTGYFQGRCRRGQQLHGNTWIQLAKLCTLRTRCVTDITHVVHHISHGTNIGQVFYATSSTFDMIARFCLARFCLHDRIAGVLIVSNST
jgi:hypothetical protein